MTALDILLWGVLPYVTIVILVAGTIWRYRYDKFGWTTRSSELYESRLPVPHRRPRHATRPPGLGEDQVR